MNVPIVTLRDLRNQLSTSEVDKPECSSHTDRRFPRGWKEIEKKEKPLVAYNDGRLRMAVYPGGIVIVHQGYVLQARTKEELRSCLEHIDEFTPVPFVSNNERMNKIVIDFIDK